MTYCVQCEFNRGDGKWHNGGYGPLTEEQARAKAAEKRARPERYRNVLVKRLDTSALRGHWTVVG